MLSPTEKNLFILLVAISLTATYNTFGNMFKIILRGQGKLNFDNFVRRAWEGFLALASQGRIIRHRKISSLFHYGVAWGFIFYGLVNILDMMEGLITGFHFLEGNIRAIQTVAYTKKLLGEIGLEPERLEFFHVPASAGPLFAQRANEMTERARQLGKNPLRDTSKQTAGGKLDKQPDEHPPLPKAKHGKLISSRNG